MAENSDHLDPGPFCREARKRLVQALLFLDELHSDWSEVPLTADQVDAIQETRSLITRAQAALDQTGFGKN